ncbi:MAG TPA: PA domain-containing protein [Jiangellaceae bacterium]
MVPNRLAIAVASALLLTGTAVAGPAAADNDLGDVASAAPAELNAEPKAGSLTQVGHEPLTNRGMNAALAIHGDYAYIGSRTDFHVDGEDFSGIMIVDISDPTDPRVVNVMGPPATANPGESSRELRVWRSQDILIVLHTNCGGVGAHNCKASSQNNIKFFDIAGENAADPQLIAQVNQNTHEFFLWEDPNDPERAFMFGGSAGSGNTALSIWDLAPLLDGQAPPRIHASGHGYTGIPPNLVTVDPPSSAAGTYEAAGAAFGPAPDDAGVSGDVVLVNDGSNNPTEGCDPLVDFPVGAIALVDRGSCAFVQKANNAQAAGATAMIVANNVPGAPFTMGGADPNIVIPSVMVSLDDGNTIKAGLPATATVASRPGPSIPTGGLHSLSVSNDGRFAFYALLTGGFAMVDVSDFTSGVDNPQLRLVTQNESRPTWSGPGAHSAVKFWGRDWVWVVDEVYGTATGGGHGCPWGWARVIDLADPAQPTVEAEFRLPSNEESNCDDWEPRPRTSYSAHNPTLTPRIAFTTWHSGGLQATSIQRPKQPSQLAEFLPEPLHEVAMEDPRLSSDPDTGRGEKVVMWSYPIIKDGLIYVVDLRNGLYILDYDGPFEKEVERITFLEGNSNQGHALCFEPVGTAPAFCGD